MAVPKIEKVVVNMGLGEATANAKIIGQRRRRARAHHRPEAGDARAEEVDRAVQGPQGQPIATMVTLRGERMWEFLDRLMSIALPRVRDFKGVSPQGLRRPRQLHARPADQLLFPEIDYMKVDKARGMNVSVVTTAKTDEEARKLLQFIGMPFRQRLRTKMATTAKIAKEAQDAEVQGPAAQPLPPVRPPARLHAEVRAVPPLLPQAGARRGRHGVTKSSW
jgi:large subunit ribosomal protein L5